MSIQNNSKILLSDQDDYTFIELIIISKNSTNKLIGYGVTKAGKVVEAVLSNPRFVACQEVLQIQLSTGEYVECSKDTLFYLELNQTILAKDLRVSDKPLIQFGGEIEITAITLCSGMTNTYTLSSSLGNYILGCGLLVQSD